MKLIKVKGHFYILRDKKSVSHKTGDWVYETNNCIPVYQFSYDMDEYPLFRVLAATIKLGTLPLIDFNQLQELMLDVLAKEHYPEESSIHIDMRKTWIDRYFNNLSGILLSEIKDESEFDVEIETKFNCGVIGVNDPPNGSVITGGEACFRQWKEPKISENGYLNILKIK